MRTRIAILGAVLLAALAMILFRLWSLQVLSGEHYRALAKDNGILEIRVQPPRGDPRSQRQGPGRQPHRDGARAPALGLRRSIGAQARSGQARVGARPLASADRAEAPRDAPVRGYPIVLKQGLTAALLFYLLENQGSLPGVSVERTYVRDYKTARSPPTWLGLVGQIEPRAAQARRVRWARPGDIIGQSGVEHTYDRYLRAPPASRGSRWMPSAGRRRSSPA